MRPTDVLRNKQGLHLDRTAVQLGGKSVSVSAIQNFHRRPPPGAVTEVDTALSSPPQPTIPTPDQNSKNPELMVTIREKTIDLQIHFNGIPLAPTDIFSLSSTCHSASMPLCIA